MIQLNLTDKQALVIHIMYDIGTDLVIGNLIDAVDKTKRANALLTEHYTHEEKTEIGIIITNMCDAVPEEVLKSLDLTRLRV